MVRSAGLHHLLLLAAMTLASPAVNRRDSPQGTNATYYAIHNTAISASNLTESLRFYVDGLGLNIVKGYTFRGDLTTLFGTTTSALPGYFLGDTTSFTNGTNGVIYLVEFPDAKKTPIVESDPPNTGLFLTSFWMGDKINATLARLERLGLGGTPHIATFGVGSDPYATYATVRDPDGARILLTSRPYINAVGQQLD